VIPFDKWRLVVLR